MIIRVQHFVWGKLIGALNGFARSKAVSLTGVIQTQIVNFAFFLDSTGRCQIPGTGVSLFEIHTSFSFLEHCADYEHDRAANMITPQTVYGKVDNKIRLLLYYTIKYSKTTI